MRIHYPLTLLLGSAITTLSMINLNVPTLSNVSFGDKYLHFLAYGALSLALMFDLIWINPDQSKYKVWAIAFIISSLWGGVMELAQLSLSVSRQGDWLDAASNMCGALMASSLLLLFYDRVARWVRKLKSRLN